jgi:hypothetical protein
VSAERAARLETLEAELRRAVVLVEMGDLALVAASERRCRELVGGLVPPSRGSLEEPREAELLASLRALYRRVGQGLESAHRKLVERTCAAREERHMLDAYKPGSTTGPNRGAFA